jgi:hypothetical protein
VPLRPRGSCGDPAGIPRVCGRPRTTAQLVSAHSGSPQDLAFLRFGGITVTGRFRLEAVS